MTVKEAISSGTRFIRKPIWNSEAYMELPLLEDGMVGVWVTLYDRPSCEAMGIENGSQKIPIWSFDDDTADDWEEMPAPLQKETA